MFRGKHLSGLLFLAAVLFVSAATQGCYTASQYNRLKEQLAKANSTIDLKDNQIEELDHDILVKQEECLALQGQIKDVERYRKNSEEAEGIIAGLKAELAKAQSKQAEKSQADIEGVEIFKTSGNNVGIRLSDKILFDSGSTAIKNAGKNALDAIAKDLKARGKKLRVEGHTDSDPVVKTKKQYPQGNIQLSAARAISVYKYLISRGVPEARMSVAGYGPANPLVPNNSAEDKQRNRRVEIILFD